jgi:hypothetical protein
VKGDSKASVGAHLNAVVAVVEKIAERDLVEKRGRRRRTTKSAAEEECRDRPKKEVVA